VFIHNVWKDTLLCVSLTLNTLRCCERLDVKAHLERVAKLWKGLVKVVIGLQAEMTQLVML